MVAEFFRHFFIDKKTSFLKAKSLGFLINIGSLKIPTQAARFYCVPQGYSVFPKLDAPPARNRGGMEMKIVIVLLILLAVFLASVSIAFGWGPNEWEQSFYLYPGVQFSTPGQPSYYPDLSYNLPWLNLIDAKQADVTVPSYWNPPEGGSYVVQPHPEVGYMEGFGFPAWTSLSGFWMVRGVDQNGRAGWFDTRQISNILLP